MKHNFNWGIIGYGNIAKNFEKNITEKKNNFLIGLSSNSKKIEKKEGVRIYNNEVDLLSNKEIDSIYISNLNSQHYKTAVNCLKYNKDFIIEKPSFINENEVNFFLDNFKSSNSFVMEGYMNIYHPQLILVKNLIQDNEIGDLKKIEIDIGFNIIKKFLFFKYYKFKKTHRLLDEKKGGGAIFDIGCYGVSSSRKIVETVFKEEIDFRLNNINGKMGQTKIDESASVSLSFNNGVIANIRCSIIKNLENTINIFGSKGEIKILEPWTPSPEAKINLVNSKGKKIIKTGTNDSAYWYEIDFFNNVLNSNNETKEIAKQNQIRDIKQNSLAIIDWRKILKQSMH